MATQVDSARSWAVAVACCWINGFILALVRSSAVIYVGTLHAFDVDRQQASWPITLTVVCNCFGKPLAGVLARYVSIWKVTLIGCIMASFAVCVSFHATNIIFLAAFLGVVQGTGVGLTGLHPVVINQHFHRHRATASGISAAGFTIGGLIFPPLVQALLQQYGFRGTLLIIGAIMLNAGAGAFMQGDPPKQSILPSQSDIQPTKPSGSTSSPIARNGTAIKADGTNRILDEPGRKCLKYDGIITREPEYEHALLHDHEALFHKRDRTEQDDDQQHCNTHFDSKGDISRMSYEMKQATDRKTHNELSDVTEPFMEKSMNNNGQLKTSFSPPCTKPDYFLSFLFKLKFYLIAMSFAQILNCMVSYMTVIVDFAADRGVTRWYAVFLITTYNISDLVARLGSGWITDKGYLSRSAVMSLHLFVWGAVQYMIPACDDFYYQVMMAVMCGWCTGCTIILVPVLFMELVGIDKLGVCYGMATLLAGFLGFARPPLIGYYRDALGDYEGLFNLFGALSASIAFLWLCIAIWERCKCREIVKRFRNMLSYFAPQRSTTPKGSVY
ncbi:uncharacterized protein LOC135389694 [Ornithodoros turicata]|uniref:uncharacterized protein LOC135389694 n=1 Tax=Ornithodoros turicata TaxID=34597 RepID=UPI003139B855